MLWIKKKRGLKHEYRKWEVTGGSPRRRGKYTLFQLTTEETRTTLIG